MSEGGGVEGDWEDVGWNDANEVIGYEVPRTVVM